MDFTPTNLPVETDFPKLVRDNIPDIIKAGGKQARTKIAENDEEYLKYLLKKMVEEAVELKHSGQADNLKEELADIFEIIYAILALQGWTIEQIIEVQKEKREKNGGFEKRILMLNKPE